MKRDIDLVRKILIHLEEKPDEKVVKELEIEGYSNNDVQYHLIIMDEAGLIRCERSISTSTPDRVIRVYPFGLTWQGHEFLESSRNETIWNKAKNISLSKSGSMSFEVIKALLISLTKEKIGL